MVSFLWRWRDGDVFPVSLGWQPGSLLVVKWLQWLLLRIHLAKMPSPRVCLTSWSLRFNSSTCTYTRSGKFCSSRLLCSVQFEARTNLVRLFREQHRLTVPWLELIICGGFGFYTSSQQHSNIQSNWAILTSTTPFIKKTQFYFSWFNECKWLMLRGEKHLY